MLGVISHRASASIVNRTLSVLEGTLAKHGNDIALIDAITICLTRLVPLLDEVGEVRAVGPPSNEMCSFFIIIVYFFFYQYYLPFFFFFVPAEH